MSNLKNYIETLKKKLAAQEKEIALLKLDSGSCSCRYDSNAWPFPKTFPETECPKHAHLRLDGERLDWVQKLHGIRDGRTYREEIDFRKKRAEQGLLAKFKPYRRS